MNMNTNSGINLKQTIQQFKKGLIQRKNRYSWDEILLFYRKEIGLLQNQDILNLIKIGLKSLSNNVGRKIRKWNKTNKKLLSSKNSTQNYGRQTGASISYQQLQAIFSSYNRVLIAFLHENEPIFFNMLFRKQITVQVKRNKKQVIFQPSQIKKVKKNQQITAQTEAMVKKEIKIYFKNLLYLSLKKLQIYLLSGKLEQLLINLQIIDKIFKNIYQTSNKFLFMALQLEIVKLNIIEMYKGQEQVELKIKYQFPLYIFNEIWKNKNKWSEKKRKHWMNCLIKYAILLLRNLSFVQFSSNSSKLIQTTLFFSQIQLIYSEIRLSSFVDKNLSIIKDILGSLKENLQEKSQMIQIISQFSNLKRLKSQFRRQNQDSIFNQNNNEEYEREKTDKNIHEKKQNKKALVNEAKKIIVKMRKKFTFNEPKQKINYHLFNSLGFETGNFQNVHTFIDESEDEDFHAFEKRRKTFLNEKYPEERISLAEKVIQSSYMSMISENAQVKQKKQSFLPYNEIMKNLTKLQQQTNRIKSYSSSSLQALKIKKCNQYNIENSDEIIKEPKNSKQIQKLNEDFKNLHKKDKKRLSIKKSEGLPKIKRVKKNEDTNEEKVGIQLNEKYDKLSRMILFSKAGKQND